MLFSPRSVSLAPRIGDDVLPTPAEEWAENTVTSIRHSADLNSLVLPPRTATPGPRVPGAYPFEGEADYSRGVALHHGYIRTQKNVMDAVMGARATAKRYLPGNLASYLPPSTERNPVLPKDTSLAEHEQASISGAANSSEAPPDHLSYVALNGSAPQNNKSEIEASSPTLPTNPETEHRSSLLSNISTRTTNGSMLSSPSRYSSQLSLASPKTEVLHSSSETADTTHHSPELAEPKHSHGGRLSNADTNEGVELPDSRNQQEADQNIQSLQDDAIEHGAQSDTPIGSPYPAFLGPVDFGNDKFLERMSGPIGVAIGSSPKPEENLEVSHTERTTEGSQQPTVHTEARTHPLAGSDAKWNGIPLEEQYQKVLDDNSDRQLNLGTPVAKPAYEERKTPESGQGAQRLKVDESCTLNGDRSASRPRTTSVVLDKPVENQRKSHRPASEGYTPAQVASNGHTMSHKRESSKGSRASFLDKLRGEMKVISGKLSNDGAKVEEGRRLMGKTA